MKLFSSIIFNEKVADGSSPPAFEPIKVDSDDDIIALVELHCSDALYMLKTGRPFIRGDVSVHIADGECKLVDPSKTVRVSQNTSNFYTSLLDNIPSWKEWPKRSRSYICTTKEASGYDRVSDDKVLIPCNGTPFGIVNSRDFWDVWVNIGGVAQRIEMWNDSLRECGIRSYIDLINVLDDPSDFVNVLDALELDRMTTKNELFDILNKAYSPKALGLDRATTATFKHTSYLEDPSEIWVSGPCLIMSKNTFFDAHRRYI